MEKKKMVRKSIKKNRLMKDSCGLFTIYISLAQVPFSEALQRTDTNNWRRS